MSQPSKALEARLLELSPAPGGAQSEADRAEYRALHRLWLEAKAREGK